MTSHTPPNDTIKVCPSDLVRSHIQGQETGRYFISALSTSCPHGGELCQLLGIDEMKISREKQAFFTGLCREIQKELERSHG